MNRPALKSATPLSDALAALGFPKPKDGAFLCAGGCGTRLAFPCACDPCAAKNDRRMRRDALVDARNSIPETFRWATLTAPELRARIRKPAAIAKASEYVRDLPLVTVVTGVTRSGKTNLVCAMLHAVIEAGVTSNEEAFRKARGSRFVSAKSLVGRRGDSDEELLDAAVGASVLVLDDMGKELDGCPPGTPLAAQRIAPIVDVIDKRHNTGRPTLIASWWGPQDVERRYGGGTSGRMFHGDRVRHIDLGGTE